MSGIFFSSVKLLSTNFNKDEKVADDSTNLGSNTIIFMKILHIDIMAARESAIASWTACGSSGSGSRRTFNLSDFGTWNILNY